MKNSPIKCVIIMSVITLLGTFLSWCTSKKENNSDELMLFLQNYAQSLTWEVSPITTGTFEWYNSSEYDMSDGRAWYEMTGYSFSASGVRDMPDIANFFDGWQINYVGDGFRSSATEMFKDHNLCLLNTYLEQDIPEELIFWYSSENTDEENDKLDQLWDDFYSQVSYTVEVSCWKIPEQALLLSETNYNLYGNKNFDDGSIRGGNLYLFRDNININEKYFDVLFAENNWITLRNYQWEVGSITKKSCTDKNHKVHPYTFQFYWSTDGNVNFYEGCADKVKSEFTVAEQGTIDTFIKKTGYSYQGNPNHNKVTYFIDNMMKNYITATIYDYDQEDYVGSNVLMEKTQKGRKTLFEWTWYSIDPDTCEELFQYDHEITEFSFLLNCPRG